MKPLPLFEDFVALNADGNEVVRVREDQVKGIPIEDGLELKDLVNDPSEVGNEAFIQPGDYEVVEQDFQYVRIRKADRQYVIKRYDWERFNDELSYDDGELPDALGLSDEWREMTDLYYCCGYI